MAFLAGLELALLSLLAWVAALSIAVRARLDGRAERLLATSLLWNLVVLVPIHVLGLLGALTAPALAALSVAVSAVVLAITFAGRPWRAHAAEVRAAFVGLARLPLDAVREAFVAKSFVLVGVASMLALVTWTAWVSYLAPSDGWDAIWYHESTIGYALQTKSYAPFAFPMNLSQQANGFPRSCEMTNLWFVIFTDRKLLEVVNSLMCVPLAAATFLLTRRMHTDRLAALGWASAIVLVPGVALELRTSYVDVHVAAILVGALHFATRPTMRVRDAWLATAALVLLIGSKSMALAWVPLLAVVALALLIHQNARTRARDVALAALGGALAIALAASITYWRNWVHFQSPLWPVGWDSPRLGIHWPGVQRLEDTDLARPLASILAGMAAAPVPGKDFADTRVHGYGLAVPFVLLPLGLVAAVVGMVRFGLDILLQRHVDGRSITRRWMLLAGLCLAMAYISPALWSARYNVELVVGLMAGTSYLARCLARGRTAPSRLLEGAVATTIAMNLVSLYWTTPPVGGLTIAESFRYARRPAAERATHPLAEWTITPEVAAARERELGKGAVVVFSDDVTFPAELWNEHFTNTLVYLPTPRSQSDALAALDQAGAAWVVGKDGGQFIRAARSEPARWELIGTASRGFPTVAFRRRR